MNNETKTKWEAVANRLLNEDFTIKAKGETKVCNVASKGYKFVWDNAKKRFGCCNYRKKEISLSLPLTEVNDGKNDAKIEDTIRHELAHAVSKEYFGEQGHGRTWQTVARQMGSDGIRCYNREDVEVPPSKYTYECANCGYKMPIHRKPRRKSSCGKCSPRYDGRYLLTLKTNY